MTPALTSSCPVCQSSQAAPELEQTTDGHRYAFLRCAACRLLFVAAPPTEAELRRWYDQQWSQEYEQTRAGEQAVEETLRQRRFQRRLNDLNRLGASGRLLDVGCQNGTFLMLARQRGWNPSGVELAPAAVAQARQQGFEVFEGTLPQAHLPGAAFDVVTLWHLLEHVPQPLEFLREIRRILKPGGLLAIETPNVDGRAFRRQGARWEYLLAPQHLCYFGAESLRQALERTGFDLASQRREGGTGIALQLSRAGLGGVRLWLRKYYRYLEPLRACYLACCGWMASPDDILVVYARARGGAAR